MNSNTILKCIDFINKPRLSFVVFLVGLIILLIPQHLMLTLGLDNNRNQYRGLIGFVTIVTGVLWLVQILLIFWYFVMKKIKKYNANQLIFSYLQTLTQEEKEIILECLYKSQQTITRPRDNPACCSLETKGILETYSAGNFMAFSFVIPPFVWQYLQKHKKQYYPELSNEQDRAKLEKKYNDENRER